MSDIGFDQPDLTTSRLRLRRLALSDAGLIHLYASDARVARMTTAIPHPAPQGSTEAFVRRAMLKGAVETVWAMDTGDDLENGLIGLITLKRVGGGVGDVGYWVAPAFWNAGYAGEAVDAIVAEAERQGFAALTAEVFQDNLPSARVLSRAGFGYIGAGESYSVARGAMTPVFQYRRDFRQG